MTLSANNPQRKTWLKTPKYTDFPIQNIPFGVFLTADNITTIGTRIGETVIDLSALHQLGYFKEIALPDDVFLQETLNDFISSGRDNWRAVRNRIAELFDAENNDLRQRPDHCEKALFPITEVSMKLPIKVGDYTDFYSSKEHAMNVGTMFRGKANALKPNWLHLPVAYHGRSSSIVPSGVNVHRPQGQKMPEGAETPIFGPAENIDFELETAFITTDGPELGQSIPVEDAENYIFGMVLFNDWSARDMQRWEYVPLGPFLAKNFASSISPWIVTLDALEPFRTSGPAPEKPQLPYLQSSGNKAFDINLEVALQPQDASETHLATSNFKYMYWNISQQLAHHTVNGCPINSGDMMGSGTISGPTKDSCGSMLELSWNGQKPLRLENGSERTFIQDYDTVIIRGYCEKDGHRIGFGECRSQLLPVIAQ